MLKHFYKTILVSFLCGSLLMLDFSFKGGVLHLNAASAETLKTQKIESGDLMSTLTMTSVGLIASRLYTYKQTTDTMIAAAGGAAFIAGEILAYFKLKDAMKELEIQITRDKDGNIDQKQIEVLIKLKQSYQEALETANTKKGLQQAAAAAFAAAAVAAAVLKSSEMLAFQGCSTVLSAAGSACPYSKGAAVAASSSLQSVQTGREAGGPSMSTKGVETGALSAFTASQATLTASLGSSASTYAAICAQPYGAGVWACPFVGACNAAAASIQSCNAVAPTCQMTGAYGVIGTIAHNPFMPQKELVTHSAPKNAFGNLLKFFIADAHADLFSPMGIASSSAIKYLVATSASLGATIDTFLFTPLKRASAWAVLSGLTFAASSSTDNQIAIIQGNITQIDSIINAMNAYKNGVGTVNPTIQDGTIQKTIVQNKNISINNLPEKDIDLKSGGFKMPCLTSEKEDKCPSFSNKLKEQADLKLMPDSMRAPIDSISKVTDGFNGVSKISASTMAETNKLANQANALKAEMEKRRKELQDKLKADGSKVDLAKDAADLEKNLRSTVQKELDKNKMSAGEMLASFGGGRTIGLNTNASVVSDTNKESKDSKAAKKAVAISPVVALPAATIPKLDDKDLAQELAKDSGQDQALSAANTTAKASETMEDFDLKNDITKDKESSLFDVISNRYQKSGYPRLFRRIK